MKYLAFACLFFSINVLAGPKLYVFDCGLINLNNLDMFNIKAEESPVREMFVPCYMVEHSKGRLLFDGGLAKNIADSDTPVEIELGTMVYERWIVDQLADMGLTTKDIDYAAYSHLHFDHVGAANAFLDSEVLMQRKEWEAAFSEGIPYADTSLFDKLKDANVKLIDGDHDVFGDGSVQLISTPGHTPGHQVLLLQLENTGPILLSGDLFHTRANRALRRVPHFNYNKEQTAESMARMEKLLVDTGATLWIEHDMELANSLEKAPAYYD
jgi:glyoxylase-like metal-dependent hydrolase (beta-lactamase superfamily II)